VDDLMNKDYKARHDMAMKKQKPPNAELCHRSEPVAVTKTQQG